MFDLLRFALQQKKYAIASWMVSEHPPILWNHEFPTAYAAEFCRTRDLVGMQWLKENLPMAEFWSQIDKFLEIACKNDDRAMVDWLASIYPSVKSRPFCCPTSALNDVVSRERLSLLMHLYRLDSQMDLTQVFVQASHFAKLAIMKWVVETNPSFDVHVNHFAALLKAIHHTKWIAPRMEIVFWLLHQDGRALNVRSIRHKVVQVAGDCQQLEEMVIRFPQCDSFVADMARDGKLFCRLCRNGKVSAAQWLYQKYPDQIDESTMKLALLQVIEDDEIAGLDWLLNVMSESAIASVIQPQLIWKVAGKGRGEVFQRLVLHCPSFEITSLTRYCVRQLLTRRNLPVLEWLVKTFPHVDVRAENDTLLHLAVENGMVDFAMYLAERVPQYKLTLNKRKTQILGCRIEIPLPWYPSASKDHPIDLVLDPHDHTCMICLTNTVNVQNHCGHVFCTECYEKLWNPANLSSNRSNLRKCSACRAPLKSCIPIRPIKPPDLSQSSASTTPTSTSCFCL